MSTSTRATARNHRHLPSGKLSKKDLRSVVAALRDGRVAIFPTETVYGMGASAFAPAGIRKIYQLKGRTWTKPLALLIPTLEAARPLVESIPPEAQQLADLFWPGPLTMLLSASPLGRLVTGGLPRIGLRIPQHPIALAILEALGVPLATTSVNRSGEEPATSGQSAAELFGEEVDWLIDAGVCEVQQASTVVDMSSYPYTVLRQGSLAKKSLEQALLKSR